MAMVFAIYSQREETASSVKVLLKRVEFCLEPAFYFFEEFFLRFFEEAEGSFAEEGPETLFCFFNARALLFFLRDLVTCVDGTGTGEDDMLLSKAKESLLVGRGSKG